MTRPILPGSSIGILGGGQLGRMLALAARAMGYSPHVLCPEGRSPAGQVADREVVAAYDDLDAVRRFAAGVAAVTFEFENVPAAAALAAAACCPVHPSAEVLEVCQHRLREKRWLAARGLPTADFRSVRTPEELRAAIDAVGLPAVLKTSGFGYDGKGQRRVTTRGEAEAALADLGGELIFERFVDFTAELSVVAARSTAEDLVTYGPVENRHQRHILDLTLAPAGLPPSLSARPRELARAVLEALDVVGVLCVELFLTRQGDLLVNELAPRPHNSGHYTIEACETSQFEQQLRAVCGLPLGDATQRAPAAMANLLGDLWWPDPALTAPREPRWPRLLGRPGVHLHLYGKSDPRPGRKMGHLTVLAADAETAGLAAVAARTALLEG